MISRLEASRKQRNNRAEQGDNRRYQLHFCTDQRGNILKRGTISGDLDATDRGTALAAAREYGPGNNGPQEHNKNIDARQICADAPARVTSLSGDAFALVERIEFRLVGLADRVAADFEGRRHLRILD